MQGAGKLSPLPDVHQHLASSAAADDRSDVQAGPMYSDGLAIDGAGNIEVADLTASGVQVISPAGEPLAYLATPEPDPFVTSATFGGENETTALITSGGRGALYAVENWSFPADASTSSPDRHHRPRRSSRGELGISQPS